MSVKVTFEIDKMSDIPTIESVGIVGGWAQAGSWRLETAGLAQYKTFNKWRLQILLPMNIRFVYCPFLFYLPKLEVTFIASRLRYVDVYDVPVTVLVQCPYMMAGPPLDLDPCRNVTVLTDDDMYNAEYGMVDGRPYVRVLEPKTQIDWREETRRRDRQTANDGDQMDQVDHVATNEFVLLHCSRDGGSLRFLTLTDIDRERLNPRFTMDGLPLTRRAEVVLVQNIRKVIDSMRTAEESEPIFGEQSQNEPEVISVRQRVAEQSFGLTVPSLSPGKAHDGQSTDPKVQSLKPRGPEQPTRPHSCRVCDGTYDYENKDQNFLEICRLEELKAEESVYRVQHVDVNGCLTYCLELPISEQRRIREVRDIQQRIHAEEPYSETHVDHATMTEETGLAPDNPGKGSVAHEANMESESPGVEVDSGDPSSHVINSASNGDTNLADVVEGDDDDDDTAAVVVASNSSADIVKKPIIKKLTGLIGQCLLSPAILSIGVGAAIVAAICLFKSK